MSKERLEEMLECYKRHKYDEGLHDMIAVLRDRFLDYEVLNERYDYDISGELACGPEHVVFYIAEYIDMLEQQNKRYRELLESISTTNKVASEIFSEKDGKTLIGPDDILQEILRKVNKRLVESE